MLAFSVNKIISPYESVLMDTIIKQNIGMIRSGVSATVGSCVKERKGIIAEKVETVKQEVWHRVARNFDKETGDQTLSLEERMEHYIKSNIRHVLQNLTKVDSQISFVDVDILDGRSHDDEDRADGAVVYQLFYAVVKDKEQQGVSDRGIYISEFEKLLSEIYLSDVQLFDVCCNLLNKFTTNLNVRDRAAEFKYARTLSRESDKLFHSFIEYVQDIGFTEAEECIRRIKKLAEEHATFVKRDKELLIRPYPTYERLIEGGVLSCPIEGEYSTTVFDPTTCSMRGKKRSQNSMVDLETSFCRISSKLQGKRIYKLCIENYLDYIYTNTNLMNEQIDTELLKWCGKYYIYVLPSGARYGFCKDFSEYLINVKRELLSNIIYDEVFKGDIVAMTERYLYFCPSSKPRFSTVVAQFYNGKTIRMDISAADNIIKSDMVSLE